MIKTIKLVHLCTFIFLLGFSQVSFSAGILDYLFRDIRFSEAKDKQLQAQLLTDIDSEQLDQAQVTASQLLSRVSKNSDASNSWEHAKVLTNAATIDALNGDYDAAKLGLSQAITLAESRDRYGNELYQILMVMAYVHSIAEDYPGARDYFHGAQSLSHRNFGVYALDQVKVIEAISMLDLKQDRFIEADRGQRLKLRLHEFANGPDSEELIPTLLALADYFAIRGSNIPRTTNGQNKAFRNRTYSQSASYFERAITITENVYGDQDPRLIRPLKAFSKMLLGSSKSHKNVNQYLERAIDISTNDPAKDMLDHASLLLELADTYLLIDDDRSLAIYRQAWDLLGDTDKRNKLMGYPVYLQARARAGSVLHRAPINAQAGEALFIEFEYSVLENGRVSEVQLIGANVSNAAKKNVRTHILSRRFRPRWFDGNPVSTKGLPFRHVFRIAD